MAGKYRERYQLHKTILIDESNITESYSGSEGRHNFEFEFDEDEEYSIDEEPMYVNGQFLIQPELADGGAKLGDIDRLLAGSSGLDYEMDFMGGRDYDIPASKLQRRGSTRSIRSTKSVRSVTFNDVTEVLHINDAPGAENYSFGMNNVGDNPNVSMQTKTPRRRPDANVRSEVVPPGTRAPGGAAAILPPQTVISPEEKVTDWWDVYVEPETGMTQNKK